MQPVSLYMCSRIQHAYSQFLHYPKAAGLLVVVSNLPSPVHIFTMFLCRRQQLETTLGESLM